MSDLTEPTALDDDYPVEHSPLEQTIARDGTAVDIYIYRGPDCSPRWILEVEDETGGSTIWDELFDADQQALDEALRVIEEDGIESFAEGQDTHEARHPLWKLQMTESPLSDIRCTLDGSQEMMGFHATCGLFAAVATAPTMLQPSAWMDTIKGEHVFEGMEEVQDFAQGVMALYNEVLRSVAEEDAHCCPEADDHDAVREFCEGYLTIAARDVAWQDDAGALALLLPIMMLAGAGSMDELCEMEPSAAQDPEAWLQEARAQLPSTVSALYGHFISARRAGADALAQQARGSRRAGRKVGRNDPCPCGSGKKYKKCCAN